jgi:glycosyltransferase involved in cell wall biosynthesis
VEPAIAQDKTVEESVTEPYQPWFSNGPQVRVAIVTNIPVPYRTPVYEQLASNPLIDLTLIFCSATEPDRHWVNHTSTFKAVYLKPRFITVNGRFIHFNADVWGALSTIQPDVVITTGYNPSHLIAFAYTRLRGARHLVMTDGTYQSETNLSSVHQWIRRRIFAKTSAFIAAAEDGFKLFKSYGLTEDAMFKSHLCADNLAFARISREPKKFDFLFAGRFVEVKNPLFALKVAAEVGKLLKRPVFIAFAGAGPLEESLRTLASELEPGVRTTFLGFAQKEELLYHYASSRIFLFPSSFDCWGVVANEACAAGLPVIVSPHASVAGELVVDAESGFVHPLDVKTWGETASRLLTDQPLYARISSAAKEKVQAYSFANAATGIAAAVAFATQRLCSCPPAVVKPKKVMESYR